MIKDHTVNKVRGIPDFAYISFEKAYKLVEPLTKKGGSATIQEFYELIKRKKTGWLGLEIKSARVWGLISEKGMSLTEKFNRISSSKDPNEKIMIKKETFLNIPLFNKIFDKYSKTGLPNKLELSNFLELEYNISPHYSPSVSKTIIDFIHNYFRDYGKKYLSHQNEIISKKEVETNLDDFFEKKKSINIKITSPVGNFDLEATNKKEFEKILKIINTLWDERSDADENQEEGAHNT
jgi:hypothetical protein